MNLTVDDAEKLTKLARASILNKKFSLDNYQEKSGVFVTLKTWPELNLRGCIGYPYPTFPLKEAIINAAKSAAYHDPRFKPLSRNEDFVIEISVLTRPIELKVKPKDYLKEIEIGKDGLIVQYNGLSGLLLPQVFVEWNANPKTALEMTCEKAGLPKNAWQDEKCKVFKFKAQIFKEETPNGKVIKENDS